MRLAFMGSPDFAVPCLRALVGAGHEVAAVYCQPPRPAGRGQSLTRCPVHQAADTLGLAVRTPQRLKRDVQAQDGFAALRLDAAVVAAYGLLLPPSMLDAPRRGCLNVHASLLPRWRGASPIQAALLAGDGETGISIMRMEEGLDTGPVLLREGFALAPSDAAPAVHDRLAALGARLLLRALDEDPPAVPQPAEGATYAGKLTRDDGRLDWSGEASRLLRQVRALNPWPGTWTRRGEEVLKVLAAEPAGPAPAGSVAGLVLDGQLSVACGDGFALRLTRLQRAGRASLDAGEFLRGSPVPAGSVLG